MPDTPRTRRRRGRISPVLVALLAAIFAALLWFVSRTSDTATDAPRLSGALWRAGTTEQPLLLYIAEQERRRTVRQLGRPSSYFSRPYTRYTLVTRRIPSGDVQDSVQLADRDDSSDNRAPRVLGVVGDHLWLWRDSLEGYRISPLALHLTPGSLAPQGSATREALPTEPRGFAIAHTLRTLAVRGRDARFYRVDAEPPTLAPLDPAELPPTNNSTKVEDRFDYLIPPERSRIITHPNSAMQKHFLTGMGTWYALLSETERSQQTSWISEQDAPNGEVARSLYRTSYTIDGRKQPELDLGSLAPVSNERFLQGGFVVRAERRVWDVPDPSSSLVISRARLGEEEPWEVVRLTRDGKVLWRTSTGLPSPYLLHDLGTHIALVGDEAGERAGERTQLVVWIDEQSGERRTLSLATGEVR